MKIIILAAGNGTRLNAEGGSIPKCLIKYNDIPNLKRIRDFFYKYGVYEDINVVIGNLGSCWTAKNIDRIKNIIPSMIVNNYNDKTNNAFSLKLALDQSSPDDIIIIDGDLFVFDDSVINYFIESKENCALAKYIDDGYEHKNKIVINEHNFVKKFGKDIKFYHQRPLIYGPILKISKRSFLDYYNILSKDKFYNKNIDSVIEDFITNNPLKVIINDAWINVNKQSDLQVLKK